MFFNFKGGQQSIEVVAGANVVGMQRSGERPISVTFNFEDFVRILGQGDPLVSYNYLTTLGRALDRNGR